MQFGFQKDLSCSSALFVLSQTVDYFVQHGSNVFMAALDARKAFNRINHVKLFEKLIERGFPGGIVKVLMDWYGKIFSCVRCVRWPSYDLRAIFYGDSPRGTPLSEALNARGVSKYSDFGPIEGYIS